MESMSFIKYPPHLYRTNNMKPEKASKLTQLLKSAAKKSDFEFDDNGEQEPEQEQQSRSKSKTTFACHLYLNIWYLQYLKTLMLFLDRLKLSCKPSPWKPSQKPNRANQKHQMISNSTSTRSKTLIKIAWFPTKKIPRLRSRLRAIY